LFVGIHQNYLLLASYANLTYHLCILNMLPFSICIESVK
jgi:hypothetical protein